MSIDINRLDIIHNEKEKSFYCELSGQESRADYNITPDNKLDLVFTYVHPELRGRGIAELLLKEFSEFARKKGMKVIPTCSYAVVFYKRHKEYLDVLDPGADLENCGSCQLPDK